LRPAEMIAFRVDMPTHTDGRSRANIDSHSASTLAHSHARGSRARVHAGDYLARARAQARALRGRFNIPIVYSSGSLDTGYQRKITSILVNTLPLHARNNERTRWHFDVSASRSLARTRLRFSAIRAKNRASPVALNPAAMQIRCAGRNEKSATSRDPGTPSRCDLSRRLVRC